MSSDSLLRAGVGGERRKHVFLILLTLMCLTAVYPLLLHSSYMGSSDLHAAIETTGSLIGLAAGLSMILRFSTLGNRLYLFMGLAFCVSGAVDLVNGVFSFREFFSFPASSLARILPATSVTGRVTLGLILLVGPVLARGNEVSADPRREVRRTCLTVMALTFFLTIYAYYAPLPRFIFPQYLLSRPADFAAGLIMLGALWAFLRDYLHKGDRLVFSVSLSLAFLASGQIMMSFSKAMYDPFFDVAHVYRVMGYVLPLVGCSISQVSVIRALMTADNALRQSEVRFRDISYSMADWIWEVDREGRYTYASGKIQEILGYSAEEVMGKTPFDFMTAEEAERVGNIFAGIVSRRAPVIDLENWNLTRDGRKVCLLTNGMPVFDEHGRLAGYRGVDKDITQRKRSEEEQKELYEKLKDSRAQLIEAEKHRVTGLLAAGVAHELSNPMMGILNFAQYCIKHTPPDDPRHSILQDIERETRCCVEIVQNLLTFARQKEEKSGMERERCDVILERVLKLMDYRIEGEGVNVRVDVDKDIPPVVMRVNEIQEVFVNLLSNALDAVRESERKEIDVEVRRENGTMRLTVLDSGHGFPTKLKEEMFDPFFTTKPVGKGTGLGLSITRNIVESHGGEIRCESEQGKMTRFEVSLPVDRSDNSE